MERYEQLIVFGEDGRGLDLEFWDGSGICDDDGTGW
jgi:hypothetical protein